jgi:alpha-L-rhamnosidase
VLGIHSRSAGFSEVDVRPDLLDLQWAKGGEPTPRGMLNVSLSKASGFEASIELPLGTTAHVSIPLSHSGAQMLVNGEPVTAASAEDGARGVVTLSRAGHYTLTSR